MIPSLVVETRTELGLIWSPLKAGFHLKDEMGTWIASVKGVGIRTITYLPVNALKIFMDPSYEPAAMVLPSGSYCMHVISDFISSIF